MKKQRVVPLQRKFQAHCHQSESKKNKTTTNDDDVRNHHISLNSEHPLAWPDLMTIHFDLLFITTKSRCERTKHAGLTNTLCSDQHKKKNPLWATTKTYICLSARWWWWWLLLVRPADSFLFEIFGYLRCNAWCISKTTLYMGINLTRARGTEREGERKANEPESRDIERSSSRLHQPDDQAESVLTILSGHLVVVCGAAGRCLAKISQVSRCARCEDARGPALMQMNFGFNSLRQEGQVDVCVRWMCEEDNFTYLFGGFRYFFYNAHTHSWS